MTEPAQAEARSAGGSRLAVSDNGR